MKRRRQEPPYPSPKGKGGGKHLLTSPSDGHMPGRAAAGQGEAPCQMAGRQRYIHLKLRNRLK